MGPARRSLILALSGVAAAGLYLGVSAPTFSRGGSGAVLFDGMAPPPRYRWLHPPRALARDNQPPSSGRGAIVLAGGASRMAFVPTDDAQALISFAPGAVLVRRGETQVSVAVVPRDPASIGAPPAGLRFDGNAYEFRGTYSSSQAPLALRKPVSIILRYASGASHILRSAGSTWTVVSSADFPAAMQRTAEVTAMGVYVVAAPSDLPFVRRPTGWRYAIGGSVLIIAAALFWIAWVGSRCRGRSRPARKTRGIRA